MYPWMTVGKPIPSSSSLAICAQHMAVCQKTLNYNHGPDDLCYTLVLFSTFEVLDLPIKGPMEDAGVVKLYEPSHTPCLYGRQSSP